jgi:hypothetical protein
MPSIAPFPRDFICEHAPSKSRVFAVLASSKGPDTLKAVLTCTSPLLAQQAATMLARLARTGGGTMLDAAIEKMDAALPAAPAASFREACRYLRNREWPEAHARDPEQDRAALSDALARASLDERARTPSTARLGHLAGSAFRVIQFAEYHVYDMDRLLAAAAAAGWSGDSGDEGDVLDAVMHLADRHPDIPGSDVISLESSGKRLDVADGDELADWLKEPVTAEFGGWEDVDQPGSPGSAQGDGDSNRPDFAMLFPVRSCEANHADDEEEMACDVCGDWQLTPRTADMLYSALSVLADEAYDDADEHRSEPVTKESANDWAFFGRLPRITWRMDSDWRRQVARGCDDLSGDLTSGKWPNPRSTAEEMALHLAIEDAPGYVEIAEDSGDQGHGTLPEHPDDYTWEDCSELLFEDHDVLMLFDKSLDGIEDPDSDFNRASGMGDLRARAWVNSFRHMTRRNPDRGFRR